MTAVQRKHLRLVGPGYTPPPPPPPETLDLFTPLPDVTPAADSVDEALIKGRAAVRIIAAEPEDPDEGFSMAEVAAGMAATDRLVEAFKVIDKLLSGSTAFTL